MKKLLIAIIGLTTLLSVNVAMAKQKSNGQPFQALWDTVTQLQQRVTEIESDDDNDSDHNHSSLFAAVWSAINSDHAAILDTQADLTATQNSLTSLTTQFNNHTDALLAADYDSGWITIPNATTTIALNHNLGGQAGSYVVETSYLDDDGSISSQAAVAGLIWWNNLDNDSINLVVTGNAGVTLDAAKVRIWKTQ